MHIHHLDPSNRRDVRRYIEFPFRLYRESPLWVPPFVNEVRAQLDPRRHPFYQHSEAAFFLAILRINTHQRDRPWVYEPPGLLEKLYKP